MACFPWFKDSKKRLKSETNKANNKRYDRAEPTTVTPHKNDEESKDVNQSVAAKELEVHKEASGAVGTNNFTTKAFRFAELKSATDNFNPDYLLGEGGFGKVFKGRLGDSGQIVAIKQLDQEGVQGTREFVVEVLTLGMVDHPNLVKLIGYCVEDAQRLLVYEYMPLGSLEDHLLDLDPNKIRKPLDWNTRMKIAAGAARGLEYLHDKMVPPVINRDVKCSNILLGEDYHSKLSDFGLAKLGPTGDNMHVSTRVMGTYGYCAPDYAMTGQLTSKSDIYSFGVVFLEIITGRRAFDTRRCAKERNLVAWVRPQLKNRKKFHTLVDPALNRQYPVRGLCQALAIAAMCIQEQQTLRPAVADLVTALNYVALQTYDPQKYTSSQRSKTDGKTDEMKQSLVAIDVAEKTTSED